MFIEIEDEFVKSRLMLSIVIPAKAGIQFFQCVLRPLDTGFHRCDDFFRDHHLNRIFHYSNIPTFHV